MGELGASDAIMESDASKSTETAGRSSDGGDDSTGDGAFVPCATGCTGGTGSCGLMGNDASTDATRGAGDATTPSVLFKHLNERVGGPKYSLSAKRASFTVRELPQIAACSSG